MRVFGLDLRSLSLFRIVLAAILLVDLAIRCTDLTAFYSDLGVLPRSVVLGRYWNPQFWSMHLWSGHAAFQGLLFALNAMAAIGLLIGYRTRLMAFLCWVFLVSLHVRNPLILQGGDLYLRMLLFWSMFLPLGACASVDRYRDPHGEPTSYTYSSFAGAALLIQVALVYMWTATAKFKGVDWQQGTAVYYALNIDQMTTRFAPVMLQFPKLLKILTWTVLWFELLGPVLFFVPFWFGRVRLAAVALFVVLHAGFALGLRLGPFPFVCTAALIPLLPSEFWDAIPRRWVNPVVSATKTLARHFTRKPHLWTLPRSVDLLALLSLVLVMIWTQAALRHHPFYGNSYVRSLCLGLRLDQTWNMFAPVPSHRDGWFVMAGRRNDGTPVDVWHRSTEISWEKPARVADLYVNERWRKYLMNLSSDGYQPETRYYAEYLCREWDKTATNAAETIKQFRHLFHAGTNPATRHAQTRRANAALATTLLDIFSHRLPGDELAVKIIVPMQNERRILTILGMLASLFLPQGTFACCDSF